MNLRCPKCNYNHDIEPNTTTIYICQECKHHLVIRYTMDGIPFFIITTAKAVLNSLA